MESVGIKSEEFYIGVADVTNLGKTDKVGAFMKFDLVRVAELLDKEFNKFMETLDPDDETVVNQMMVSIKILPLKEENTLDTKTHSVKLQFSFENEL